LLLPSTGSCGSGNRASSPIIAPISESTAAQMTGPNPPDQLITDRAASGQGRAMNIIGRQQSDDGWRRVESPGSVSGNGARAALQA